MDKNSDKRSGHLGASHAVNGSADNASGIACAFTAREKA
jgi:hypothetical protein